MRGGRGSTICWKARTLNDALWLPIPGYSNLPGSRGRVSYTNPPPDAGARFYRGKTRLE